MAKKICLGIHYRPDGITAVLVYKQGNVAELGPTFKLQYSGESAGENIGKVLGELHGQILEQLPQIPMAALSLSSRFYQTEFFHSEFSDDKLLKQTLRFDLEENTTIPAESSVLCYQRRGAGEDTGCDLLVLLLLCCRTFIAFCTFATFIIPVVLPPLAPAVQYA